MQFTVKDRSGNNVGPTAAPPPLSGAVDAIVGTDVTLPLKLEGGPANAANFMVSWFRADPHSGDLGQTNVILTLDASGNGVFDNTFKPLVAGDHVINAEIPAGVTSHHVATYTVHAVVAAASPPPSPPPPPAGTTPSPGTGNGGPTVINGGTWNIQNWFAGGTDSSNPDATVRWWQKPLNLSLSWGCLGIVTALIVAFTLVLIFLIMVLGTVYEMASPLLSGSGSDGRPAELEQVEVRVPVPTPAQPKVSPQAPPASSLDDADGDGYSFQDRYGKVIDCMPNDPKIHPGALEICNDGIDNDCDGRELKCLVVDPNPKPQVPNKTNCCP